MVPDDPPTNLKKSCFITFYIFFCNFIFFGPDGHLDEFGRSPGPFFEKTIFYNFYNFWFLVITHHYLNPVLFSCGPCDSAYLTLYMNIFSPQVFEIFREGAIPVP